MFLSPCFSARLKRSTKEPVPYCKEALRQDLTRVQIAWDECQSSRDRNAIYGYLSVVFDLVMWWAAEGRAVSRARWALQLQHLDLPTTDEPFAAIIRCTSDPSKVDFVVFSQKALNPDSSEQNPFIHLLIMDSSLQDNVFYFERLGR